MGLVRRLSRLVNGEGDRLSGLVVDVFDNMIGVSSSAMWVERFRPEIETALRLELGANRTEIVWRRNDGRLQQDGWKGINRDFSVDAGGHDGEHEPGAGDITVKSGTPAEGAMACADWSKEEKQEGIDGNGVVRCVVQSTVVRELGLEYEVRLQLGQKTGGRTSERGGGGGGTCRMLHLPQRCPASNVWTPFCSELEQNAVVGPAFSLLPNDEEFGICLFT